MEQKRFYFFIKATMRAKFTPSRRHREAINSGRIGICMEVWVVALVCVCVCVWSSKDCSTARCSKILFSTVLLCLQSVLPRCFSTWSPPWLCSLWTPLVAVLAWASPSSGPSSLPPAHLSVGTVLCIKPSGLNCDLDSEKTTTMTRPAQVDISQSFLTFLVFFLLGVTAPSISFSFSLFSSPKWSSASSWRLASLDGGSGTTDKRYFLLSVLYYLSRR